jgi:CheY-like chemotaxis protein
MEKKKLLGEIFVETGILSQKTVERMLVLARRVDKRFGTLLEDLGLITGEELAAALARQYSCRVAGNFAGYPFPPEVLACVPAEVAMQNHIFPLKLDGNRLALAMADPTDTKVVRNIASDRKVSITPYIATRKEIYAAICRHYLHRELCDSEVSTVLVAEGDKLVSTMFKEILTRNGYRVVTAVDGFEAYKAAMTHQPQVVITDLMLPKLDGYGLFNSLRSNPELQGIPVILVGTSIGPDDEVKAFERGFFDIIQKPVREATLVTRLKRALQFQERKYQVS